MSFDHRHWHEVGVPLNACLLPVGKWHPLYYWYHCFSCMLEEKNAYFFPSSGIIFSCRRTSLTKQYTECGLIKKIRTALLLEYVNGQPGCFLIVIPKWFPLLKECHTKYEVATIYKMIIITTCQMACKDWQDILTKHNGPGSNDRAIFPIWITLHAKMNPLQWDPYVMKFWM